MKKIISLLLLFVIGIIIPFSSCFRPVSSAPESSSTSDPSDGLSDITDEITTEEASITTEVYFTRWGVTDPVMLENFDLTLSHKPTVYDILQLIKDVGLEQRVWFLEEVPIPDIIARFGKPHNYGPISMFDSLVWYTEDGMYVRVVFYIPEEAPTDVDPVQRQFDYGVALGISIVYNQEDSEQPVPSYLFEK